MNRASGLNNMFNLLSIVTVKSLTGKANLWDAELNTLTNSSSKCYSNEVTTNVNHCFLRHLWPGERIYPAPTQYIVNSRYMPYVGDMVSKKILQELMTSTQVDVWHEQCISVYLDSVPRHLKVFVGIGFFKAALAHEQCVLNRAAYRI